MGSVKTPRGRIVLATHNRGKIDEFSRLAVGHGIEFVTAPELGLPIVAETEGTYLGNAQLKARAAVETTGQPALADDTGIEVASLDGAPGVETAGFATRHGGWRAALEAWNEQLGLRQGERPRATAVCALVLAWPDGTMWSAQARVDGELGWPPVQRPGFAAVFRSDGETFERDGVLLHRRRAFDQLLGSATS